jgi:hypothetical protein
MHFKYLSLFLFCFSVCKCYTQIDTEKRIKDSITVIKDDRLDILTQKQTVINKRSKMMTSNGLYKGFRLQLLNTNNREVAFKMKYDLLQNYPDHKAYVSFQAPYFKVRFGNFLKRAEAEQMKKLIQKNYKGGVYIVEDAIEYMPKDDEDVR